MTDAPYGEASKFLGYVVQAAAAATLAVPARQYVTAGQAVYDCEQVAVTMVALNSGLPGQTTQGAGSLISCMLPQTLVLEAAIVRCSPVAGSNGKPPSITKLNDHAQLQARDAEVLMAASQLRMDERFGNVTVQIAFPPPSGGMSATLARVQVAISL